MELDVLARCLATDMALLPELAWFFHSTEISEEPFAGVCQTGFP